MIKETVRRVSCRELHLYCRRCLLFIRSNSQIMLTCFSHARATNPDAAAFTLRLPTHFSDSAWLRASCRTLILPINCLKTLVAAVPNPDRHLGSGNTNPGGETRVRPVLRCLHPPPRPPRLPARTGLHGFSVLLNHADAVQMEDEGRSRVSPPGGCLGMKSGCSKTIPLYWRD